MRALRLERDLFFENEEGAWILIPKLTIVTCLTTTPVQYATKLLWWTHIYLTPEGILRRPSYYNELEDYMVFI